MSKNDFIREMWLPVWESGRSVPYPLECKGLFIQGDRVTLVQGYSGKRVKVSFGLQANFTGRVTLSPGSTLPALPLAVVFRHACRLLYLMLAFFRAFQ